MTSKKNKSEEQMAISRRRFIKTAGIALGVGAAACGGTAYFGLKTPAGVAFPESSCGVNEAKHVLVAYTSKCGATAETAAYIAQKLCDQSITVDWMRAKNVITVSGYQAVILGSAIYMGKLLGEAENFISAHQAELSAVPVALYDVCLSAKEEAPEKQAEALAYLDPLRKYVTPVSIAAFPGRIALETLPPLYRMIAKADAEGILAEGDYRDWDAVNSWIAGLPAGFLPV